MKVLIFTLLFAVFASCAFSQRAVIGYGEPPPDYFEVAEIFLSKNHDSITVCRGWIVNFKMIFGLYGYTEGSYVFKVTKTNAKATFYHKEYIDTLYLSYGLPDDRFSIKIK